MVWSVLFQEIMNRGATFGLAKCEEKASQGHLKERLEMAANEMELALERSAQLPITDLSLLQRRKMIKRGYVEAMELLNKDEQEQQVVPAGPELQDAQGVKRKLWVICAKNMSLKPFVALSTDAVRRFEWYADRAGRFLRDLESGCSLHHYTFCNPIVRYLLEGKTLIYRSEQGSNVRRGFCIWSTYSADRGMEAVLGCCYGDSTMTEKSFRLWLILRLSESTDIVGAAIKGLQLLKSDFKLAAEFAMGELTLLSNSQDIAHSYGPPWVGIQEWHMNLTQFTRPDPACCKGSRHRLCANNNVSPELSDIFPEPVIYWGFKCYYVPAVKVPSSNSTKPPLLMMIAVFTPHFVLETSIGDQQEYTSIQEVVQAIKSDAINCFFCQPAQTEYDVLWHSRHGSAYFKMEKRSMERTGGPKQGGGTIHEEHKERSQEVARLPVLAMQQHVSMWRQAQANVAK